MSGETQDNNKEAVEAEVKPAAIAPSQSSAMEEEEGSDYAVSLENYHGPLDLLLYLIKKEEVDIWDIPISRIADQYLQYVRLMQQIDIEGAGEFIQLAAHLMEVKSRMLIPRPVEDGGEIVDPRSELIQQLLEYKKYKDASMQLSRMEDGAALRFFRLYSEKIEEDKDPDAPDAGLQDITLWHLMDAFGRVMESISTRVIEREIVYSDVPIRDHMQRILHRLREKPVGSFLEFFDGMIDRGMVIGVFIAILELVKQSKIKAEQGESGGDIRLILREEVTDEVENEIDTSDDYEG